MAMLGLSLVAACDKPDATAVNAAVKRSVPAAEPTASIPNDGSYVAKGTITKINLKLGSIEIKHEEIPGMLMPAMQMEFKVRDQKILYGLKVGDNVEFVLEYKHPTETVVSIKKVA